MSKRNKQRGYELENETVHQAKSHNFHAVRTWGSDGRSRDLPKNVDVVVDNVFHLQCKRQKRKVSQKYLPEDNIHAQIIRGDYQEAHAVRHANRFFKMMKKAWIAHHVPEEVLRKYAPDHLFDSPGDS